MTARATWPGVMRDPRVTTQTTSFLYVFQNVSFAVLAAFLARIQDTHSSSTAPTVCSSELIDGQPAGSEGETWAG